MTQLVSQETWDAYVAEVDKHNASEPSTFTDLNDNDKVEFVTMTPVPADLEPLPSYAPDKDREAESKRLALRPLTAADCQMQCVAQAEGGCWCDEQCSNYGDCCADYEEHCAAE